MGECNQGNDFPNLNSSDIERLLDSVRHTDGYLEMSMKIRQLVLLDDSSPLERLKTDFKRELAKDAPENRELLNEIQHDLVEVIMKKVADLDSMAFDERLFMMLMIEDVVRKIVGEALKKTGPGSF